MSASGGYVATRGHHVTLTSWVQVRHGLELTHISETIRAFQFLPVELN